MFFPWDLMHYGIHRLEVLMCYTATMPMVKKMSAFKGAAIGYWKSMYILLELRVCSYCYSCGIIGIFNKLLH